MYRLIAASVLLFAAQAQAATLSTTGPSAGLTEVTVDQPYGQFSKAGLTGDTLQSIGSTFWTDAPQVWITDYLGVGSLHTLVLTPDVSLIAVRPTYGPELTTQEFGYEYHINSSHGLLRQELGPINLPYGAASLAAIPEPATALLGLMGAGVLWVGRRR